MLEEKTSFQSEHIYIHITVQDNRIKDMIMVLIRSFPLLYYVVSERKMSILLTKKKHKLHLF